MDNDELAATVTAQGERIAALEAAMSHLMPARRAAPKFEEGVVRIRTGRAARGRSAFVMPNDAELLQLYKIVTGKFLQLGPRAEKEAHLDAFQKAFRALGDFGRVAAPDLKHSAIFWLDQATEKLRAEGISSNLTLPPFTAAVVAHADILFAPLNNFPHDLAFGLADGDVGKPASDGWRKLLAMGKVT